MKWFFWNSSSKQDRCIKQNGNLQCWWELDLYGTAEQKLGTVEFE
jgi:hypothetical protein